MNRTHQWVIILSLSSLVVIVFVLHMNRIRIGNLQAIIQSMVDSKEVGRMVIHQQNGQTVAELTMGNYKNERIQSVSIVSGSCENRKEVLYHLTYLFTGYSNTTLDIRIQTLIQKLPLAVVVTETKQWESPVVFCGNVQKV